MIRETQEECKNGSCRLPAPTLFTSQVVIQRLDCSDAGIVKYPLAKFCKPVVIDACPVGNLMEGPAIGMEQV